MCTFETLLSGFGGAIFTYVIYKINAPIYILCFVGGFGSIMITPLTAVITNEAKPTLELIVKGIQTFIKKYIKKNT